MANLNPSATFDNVQQLETTTVALGGAGNPMNVQAQALLNRTQYLYVQLSNLSAVASTGDYNSLINRPALGSAAYQPSSAFATAAQGAKADGAAQASALSAAAFSGSYLDLSNRPAVLPDAPLNANTYGRKNGAWVIVSGASGGAALPVAYLEDYGCDPTGVADSTAGFQAAIAALATSGGVIMSKQIDAIFLIGGALQDTTGANAQLTLPVKNYGGDAPITVAILGYKAPPAVVSVVGSEPIPTGGLVIKSTLATGTGSVIGGANGTGFTNVNLVLKNLTVRAVSNPTLSGIDASKIACIEYDGLLVDTGSFDVSSLTQPTTTTSYGIKFPAINNGAHTTVGVADVVGFYTGFMLGEHTTANQLNAWGCVRAAESPAGYHAMLVDRMQSIHCQHGLVATGGTSYLQVNQFNVEHAASGWQAPVDDVLDSSNYLVGSLRWHAVLAGSGPSSSFTQTGGSGFTSTQLGASTSGSSFPVSSDTTLTSLSMFAADVGKYIRFTATTAKTFTVRPDSTEPLPANGEWHLRNVEAGDLTIVANTGVTINAPYGGGLILHPGATATLKRVATDVFDLIGQGASS